MTGGSGRVWPARGEGPALPCGVCVVTGGGLAAGGDQGQREDEDGQAQMADGVHGRGV